MVTFADQLGLGTALAVRLSMLSAALWWAGFVIIPWRRIRRREPADVEDVSGGVVARSFGQLFVTLRELPQYPVALTFLLAYLLLKERLTARQLAGIAVSLCGALLVICRGEPTQLLAFTPNRGDVLVFVGMSCWALYTVLIRRRPPGLPPMAFLGVTMFFGVLFHLPAVAWEHIAVGGFRPTLASAGALFYLAVFPSILAYIFWNRSVATLGPGKTGMFMHLLPPSSALLGFIVLGETIAWFHLAGFAIIIGGIWLATSAPRPARS